MANSGSGGAGSKFLSVNLNKSYGRSQSGSRFPSAGHHGGGGGMVVLSRPRSGGVKAGPRVFVPPPMNLPSLRKEHEKFDSAAGGAGGAGHGGVGSRSMSGGIGWTKPVVLERENDGGIGQGVLPATRMGGSSSMSSAVEKAVVLRGEDFPSLQAALPSSNGSTQKHKDGAKVKIVVSDVSSSVEDRTDKSSQLHMPSHIRSLGLASDNRSSEKVGVDSGVSDDLNALKSTRKQHDLFLGPLPLDRLPHRSDWADDERDTSIGTLGRDRELKGDGEFDISKTRYPNTHGHNFSEIRGKIDDENRKVKFQVNSFGADVKGPSRENRDANSWRSSNTRDRHMSNEMMEKGGSSLRSIDFNRDNNTRFGEASYGKGARESYSANSKLVHDSRYGRSQSASRWANNGLGVQNNGLGSSSFDNSNRFENSPFQKSPISSFSMGSKGATMKDPLLNLEKEKHSKSYVEEPFGSSDFEKKDFFSGSFMMKKKKGATKQLEFYDPVRESFEAELERVQQIHEQERKRVAEEQARASELAQKEEEERQRLARVEEDRRKRVEEEAKKSAWREERERLEALRRVEEQRTAREEEKKMILVEEERRKEAAKQKLLELEAKIASRQSDSLMDNKMAKRDVERMVDVEEWEDSERMVERITSSTSETFGVNRRYDSGSRFRFSNSRGGSANILDGAKHVSSLNRDAVCGSSSSFSAYDIENSFHEFRSESLGGEKALQRREYFNVDGMIPLKKTSTSEIQTNEYSHFLNRTTNIDSEFTEVRMNRFGDIGWGHDRSRNVPHSPKAERFYHNLEVDGFSSFSRPRYLMRQPRVPPPPSLASIHKSSLRCNNDASAFLNDDARAPIMMQNEMEDQAALNNEYKDEQQDYMVRAASTDDHSVLPLQSFENKSFRCDSQSSRSVSSPPDSQNHLSHDEIDISVESSEDTEVEIQNSSIMNNQLTSVFEGGSNQLMTTSNVTSFGEDEEWFVENNQDLPLQEEYDDEYKRVDDAHEDEDENVGLSHEREGRRLEEPSESDKTDHLILGFDEGVEVKLLSGDEYEKSTSNIEKTSRLQQGSSSFDTTLIMDSQSEQGALLASGGTLETSSELLDETEKPLQQLLITSTDTSESLGVPTRKLHHSSPLTVASPSTVRLPSASVIPSSIESDSSPVQLQFGLFTGPSLFPSPTIQIGSIQMPLSLQQHMSPPVAPIHHSNSPSYFQFGQYKYTSSTSQGVLPSTPPPISLMRPAIPAQYPLNHVNGEKHGNQVLQGYSVQSSGLLGSHSLDMNRYGFSSGAVSFDKMDMETNILRSTENAKPPFPSSRGSVGVSLVNEGKDSLPFLQVDKRQEEMFVNNGNKFYNNRDLKGQQPSFLSSDKKIGGSNYRKGKKFDYSVKTSSSDSLLPSPSDDLRLDSGASLERSHRKYRTEFRMRENHDKKQFRSFASSSSVGPVGRPSNNMKGLEVIMPAVNKKGAFCGKQIGPGRYSGSVSAKMQNSDHNYNGHETIDRQASSLQQFSDGDFSIDNGELEDIDSSIKSGTVQVFKQADIEARSDDDDFIEVRSKRQMLNERREQREKEMKLKSRLAKAPRKPCVSSQRIGSFSSGNKSSFACDNGVAAVKSSGLHMKEAEALSHVAVPDVIGTVAPSLPPIGTPRVHEDGKSEIKCFNSMFKHVGPTPTSTDASSRFPFDSEKVVPSKAATPLVPWMGSSLNQQLMGLTPTHLDEAMKPSKVMTQVSCIGDPSFLSDSVHLNSMLSGENIQFGAISSPFIPSSSSSIPNDIRPIFSDGTNISINKNTPGASSVLFFETCKHADELSLPLDNEEAEAEAAASGIAVAAITNDDVVNNQLSHSTSNEKSHEMTKLEALPAETFAGTNSSLNHKKSEQSLSNHLPIDLCVETPSLSLWPPLPSPHFSGALPFPFYEMNPMLGRPIYSFGPQDESTSNKLQSHTNNSTTSEPVGAWQQCHSSVDSFYGPSNGFAGSFISGPRGVPGMQVPPHMLVYNHFAPFGQFGQVGLSYMGTTYVPSGKQPDWKHSSIFSGVTPSENDENKLDATSGQQNPLNMSGSIQHLAPSSPLLPLPPSLALCDISPFQSTPEILMSARWPQAIGAIPSSMSLNQEMDGSVPQQFNQNFLVDPMSGKKPQESQTSNPVNGNVNMPTPSDSSLFTEDLGLLGSKSNFTETVFSNSSRPASQNSVNNPDSRVPSGNNIDDKTHKTTASIVSLSTRSSVNQNVTFSVNDAIPSHQQSCSVGYSGQRVNGSSHKVNSGNEWRRRLGYQGRNQTIKVEKGFSGSSKVKQIYVAKRSTGPESTSTG